MDNKIFKAYVVTENEDKTISTEIAEKSVNDLPDGDVIIKVQYSSLNYKDALSASGNRGVTKNYPHTPGIDVAGVAVNGLVDGTEYLLNLGADKVVEIEEIDDKSGLILQ